MYYYLLVFALLAGSVHAQGTEDFHCQPGNGDTSDFPREVCYTDSCMTAVKSQIKEEMTAAFAYMYMAARFDEDVVYRPGIANFFYGASSEERSHAKLMLDYLNFRGMFYDEKFSLNFADIPLLQEVLKSDVVDYRGALKTALNLEISVTDKIHKVISQCSGDFHGADKFTEPIQTEQHEGIRKLQGAIKSFDSLALGHSDNPQEIALAEFLFDQKLLSSGEF